MTFQNAKNIPLSLPYRGSVSIQHILIREINQNEVELRYPSLSQPFHWETEA
jgi:hypothetical protein